jgi:FkbM family methyltransferase
MYGKARELTSKITRGLKKLGGIHRGRISFSQCGEDLLVDHIFRLRGFEFPSYLDIGANDPFSLSNTALFYGKGCRGINIEANPQLISRINRYRKNDINLNIGIGRDEGELDFYILSDSTLSSFSKDETTRLTIPGKIKIVAVKKIKLTTLEKVIDTYCNGKFPDFLSIDVEGMDLEILHSIPFEKYWPKVICAEAAEYSPTGTGARKHELINFIISKGYYEYANTNLNTILVKNEFWFI